MQQKCRPIPLDRKAPVESGQDAMEISAESGGA
jgi:hypothetical protein